MSNTLFVFFFLLTLTFIFFTLAFICFLFCKFNHTFICFIVYSLSFSFVTHSLFQRNKNAMSKYLFSNIAFILLSFFAVWWFSSRHLYLLHSFSKNQRFSLKSSLQLIANLLIFSCIRNLFTCQSFLLFPEFDAGSRIIISMRERFLCHFRTLNPFGRISRLSGGWERWKIFEKKYFKLNFNLLLLN